jgi:putative addiction module component (TIGR02574 family)
MTTAAEQLKSQLSRLSAQERAELAHFLIRSLDESADDDAEAAWDAELQRRAEEVGAGRVEGIPAEQVFAELRRKAP